LEHPDRDRVAGYLYHGQLFLTIFNNPNSPINPFPPAVLPTLYQTNTPTSTIIPKESTWTPTITTQPEPSRTKAPTWTMLPQLITPSISSTFTIAPIEGTPTITVTPMPASAEITYMASTEFKPEKNCDWLGVAGKVLGVDGKPLLFQTIQLGGTLEDKPISLTTLSGTAQVYGQSGFERTISDHPIASSQTIWIQLFDNTSKPLTNRIYFDTYEGCDQNLVMINFTITR
jgi:hypothetical protein